MTTVYHIGLSGGVSVNLEAQSAADAMGMALEQNRGLTVVSCWSGDREARIDYEVPKHQALPTKEKRRVKRERLPELF